MVSVVILAGVRAAVVLQMEEVKKTFEHC